MGGNPMKAALWSAIVWSVVASGAALAQDKAGKVEKAEAAPVAETQSVAPPTEAASSEAAPTKPATPADDAKAEAAARSEPAQTEPAQTESAATAEDAAPAAGETSKAGDAAPGNLAEPAR